jgi:hypothetical protein
MTAKASTDAFLPFTSVIPSDSSTASPPSSATVAEPTTT